MKFSSCIILITSGLALAGCDLLNASNGGGGGGTGGVVSSGGSASGAIAGAPAVNGTSTGSVVAVKGFAVTADKTTIAGTPILDAAATPYAMVGNNQRSSAVTGVLDVTNATVVNNTTATGTASLYLSNGYPGLQNGAGSGGFGQAIFGSQAGKLIAVRTDDQNKVDFFGIEVGIDSLAMGPSGVVPATATTGVLYGGEFAPTSAIAGQTTATYSRTNGARINTVKGFSATTGGTSESGVMADVSLTADFVNGRVNGTITGAGTAGGLGEINTSSQIVLSNATINGTDFAGGTATLKTGANNVYDTGATSNFMGSFMGATAQAAGGVLLIEGNIGGTKSMTTGSFLADKQ